MHHGNKGSRCCEHTLWEISWLGILGKSRSYLSVAKAHKPISSDTPPRKMHYFHICLLSVNTPHWINSSLQDKDNMCFDDIGLPPELLAK